MNYYRGKIPHSISLVQLGRMVRRGQIYSVDIVSPPAGNEFMGYRLVAMVLVSGRGLVGVPVWSVGVTQFSSRSEAERVLVGALASPLAEYADLHLPGSDEKTMLCGCQISTRVATYRVVSIEEFEESQSQCERCMINAIAIGIFNSDQAKKI